MKLPDSMDGLAYFRRQNIGKGNVIAWVKKGPCPKCKTLMGKPVEKGKIKIRAKEYSCPKCQHIEDKDEHLDRLEAEIIYKCPKCGNDGETKIPFKRKQVRVQDETGKEKVVDALVFNCDKCKEKIVLAKKMAV